MTTAGVGAVTTRTTTREFEIGERVSDKVSESGHVWDGVVGLRGATDLNERWYITYYADVGTGDSDLTWQGLAAVNYRFSKVDAVVANLRLGIGTHGHFDRPRWYRG